MTGVNIIHTKQVPSIRRKAIRTAILKAIETEKDRPLVLQIPLTPVIRTFLLARTGQNPTADPEKEVKEALASLQLMGIAIISLLTATHMEVIATVNPIMSTMTRVLHGLSIQVLQEKFIITTARQRSHSGRNPKSGLNEKEEKKRERKGRSEMWLEQKMEDVMGGILPSTENTCHPLKQANICCHQKVLAEIIIALLTNEMVITWNQGTPQLTTEKMSRDPLKMTECIRWLRRIQCTPQLFLQLFTDLLLLQQMLVEKRLFLLQEACKMFHHQQHHLLAPTHMGTTHHILHLQM